jgi:hypothetical protein
MRTHWALLAFILGSALVLTACGKSSDSRKAYLEKLGVKTDIGARKDPDGKPVPETYNALGKQTSVLAPLSELFFAGATLNGKHVGLVELDPTQTTWTWKDLYSDPSASWDTLPKAATACDFDGDGLDEVAVFYYVASEKAIKVRVVDGKTDNTYDYAVDNRTIVPGVEQWTTPGNLPALGAACGDIDGDGRAEAAVTAGRNLYVVDDSWTLLKTKTFPGTETQSDLEYLEVDTGNFDTDANAEILVVDVITANIISGVTKFVVLDGPELTELKSGLVQATQGSTLYSFGLTFEAVGDVDGDRLDEIVFFGATQTGNMTAIIMDDARADFRVLTPILTQATGSFIVKTLDIDGDGADEILIGNKLYDDLKTYPTELHGIGEVVAGATKAVVGDFNNDHREDLLLYGFSETGLDILAAYGYDDSSTLKLLSAQNLTDPHTPVLVAANVDKDSLILRYDGKKELLFSDPVILAVMASPPYHKDVGQNLDATGTTFGKSSGTTVETQSSLGFTVGVSIGTEFEAPLLGCTAACVEVKATFEAAMDWTSSSSSSITKSYSYSSGPEEDKVVFTAVPFDVYYYTIISAPDEETVGTEITINVPRDPQTLSVSRDFFNANNGDTMDVDSSILKHTLGDVHSYPTKAEKTALLVGGGFENGVMTVGEGAGLQTIAIDVAKGQGSGVSTDLDVKVEAEVTAAGVKVGASAGFHYGFEYQVSTEQTMFFQGTIGDIPGDKFSADLMYKFGIFAYWHPANNGQKILVVNYWTE